MNKTSLSAGLVIYAALNGNEEVKKRVTKVYPVVADSARLPYVFYAVTGMDQNPVKRAAGADTLTVRVSCCTVDYPTGAELAEAVRAALDGCQYTAGGLTMRRCVLTDYLERWEDDAFIRDLYFTLGI